MFIAHRFDVIEKRNRNLLRRLLNAPVSEEASAEAKARLFYQGCVDKSDQSDRHDREDLAALVEQVGGWSLTGDKTSVGGDLGDRLHWLHNLVGIDALFEWGVTPYQGTYRIAVIAGKYTLLD